MNPIRVASCALVLALGCITGTNGALAEPVAQSPAAASGAHATEATPGAVIDSPETSGAASPTLGWSTTYATRYAFQGLDYSDGKPVVQPAATASLRGFTAGLWGNVDQTRGELNEIDATLQGEFERGRMSGALGYAYLHYPHREDWAPTHETYLDVALDAPFAPSLSVHWDVDAGAGRYWTFGIGRDFESARGTLGLSAKLYAHEHYYGMTGFPAFETAVSFAGTWGSLALQPMLARQWAWENGDYRDDLAIEPGWVASLNIAPQ